MKQTIADAKWWETGDLIKTIVEPIITLLRLADSELPLMGKVYNHMSMIGSRLEDPEFAPELTAQQRTAISKIHEDRWKYMHNHYRGGTAEKGFVTEKFVYV